MSEVNPAPLGEFHARMREVEPGVFRAEYQGELNPAEPDARAFPDFHLGTSQAEVKTWVEQMARAMGYARVVWDAIPPAVTPPPVETGNAISPEGGNAVSRRVQ